MLNADLLIVGGRLVGASLATAVSSHPFASSLNVVLVDPSPPSIRAWPSTSLRTSTITPSSKTFLDDIGMWARIPDERIAAFDNNAQAPVRTSNDLRVRNAFNDAIVSRVTQASKADIMLAIETADVAQTKWRNSSIQERSLLLQS